DALATWEANPGIPLVDKGGLAETLARMAARPRPPVVPADELALAVAAIAVGVARARRGETLARARMLAGDATAHLIRAVVANRRPDPRADPLDPFRRAEQVVPELAAAVAAAVARPPEDAARELLALCIAEAAHAAVHGAAAALATRFGW